MKTPFIYILFLWCCLTTGQEPVTVHLTEKDGLPDKEFYGIAEDSKGFIWLAGNSGLTRYDGKEYTTYSHPLKRGLSVFELQIDSRDRVWCINISGQVFYFEDGELHLFKDLQKELNGTLPSMKVVEETLMLVTHLNTYLFNTADKSQEPQVYSNLYQPFLKPLKHQGKLLFYHQDRFLHAQTSKETDLKKLPQNFNAEIMSLNSQSKSASFRDQVFIFSQNQLSFKKAYHSTAAGWSKLPIPPELEGLRIIKTVAIDGKLWIATNNGVFLCDFIDNALAIEKRFFQNSFITAVLKDRDANYWFTTLQDGIQIIPNIHINKIKTPEDLGRISKTIATLGDKLIIGFDSGNITEYDQQSQQFRNFDSQSLKAVTEIVLDTFRDEYLVVHKLKATRYKAGDLQVVDTDLKLSSSKKIVLINKDTALYVNSHNGLLSSYPSYEINPALSAPINVEKRGYTCIYDAVERISYLGMVDELVSYDSKLEKTVLRFKDKNILTRSMVLASDGGIWVATFSNGLLHIKNGKVVQHISSAEGLLSDNVQQLAVDGEYLWMATKKGIQKVHPKTLSYQCLTKRDGVLSYDINDIIAQKAQVVFSSSEGIFTADKKKMFKKFRPLDVYVTSIKINKQEREVAGFYEVDSDKSAISISFNSAGYRGSSSGSYQYRMLGLDRGWITVPTGNDLIQYGNLLEGDYTFQLKATDPVDGTNPLKEIQFEVTTVVYKKPWFWMLLLLAAVVFIVIYYRRKLRFRESEKNKQLSQLQRDKEMINLKLENLRSQMNPHFVFNALNSIQDYIVRNHKNLASDYLGKFADLIRIYLEHSVKSRITLAEEMQTLEMYLELEKLRFEDKLNYQIKFDATENPERISIPTMLVQPYVENSLKHGLLHKKSDRKLEIHFEYCKTRELLTCTITDNGVGRKKAREIKADNPFGRASFAAKATENRLQLLNQGHSQNIEVVITDLETDGNATGTSVVVTIPHKITGYESNHN
ncbi:MAG: histidine kinase [Nonlabens sp.]